MASNTIDNNWYKLAVTQPMIDSNIKQLHDQRLIMYKLLTLLTML